MLLKLYSLNIWTYDRVTCNVKMEKNIEEAVMAMPVGDEEH
jgi:hypothetical protein